MPKLLYRVDEVEKILSFGKTKIYKLIKKGELQVHNDSPGQKGTRITGESIISYVEKYKIELSEKLA